MDYLDSFISTVDYVLNTRRRRHIAGGVLLSISALFGGLAVTAMTLKISEEEESEKSNIKEDEYNEYYG